MQVPDQILRSVAFVYCERKGGKEVRGTTFFVACPESDDDRFLTYAVTARHVIDGIRERTIDGQVHIRANTMQGAAEFLSIPLTAWKCDEDPRIDVAVTPCPAELLEFNVILLPRSMGLTDEVIRSQAIGPGDDLIIAGLFAQHPGTQVNVPIVRSGNIAAMPGEPIQTANGPMRMYLIEARSIGGLSGSPVFLHLSGFRDTPSGTTVVHGFGRQILLLGMMQGHFGLKDILDDFDAAVPDEIQARSINLGIGLVVPINDVFSVIDRPEFSASREIYRRSSIIATPNYEIEGWSDDASQ